MIKPVVFDEQDIRAQAFALEAAFRHVGVELQRGGASAAAQAIEKLQGLLRLMHKLNEAAINSETMASRNGASESQRSGMGA